MIAGSIIYILVHETNHLNRMLNFEGEWVEGHLTQRYEKYEKFVKLGNP